MSTAHLTDDLLSIACGSVPGEMSERLSRLLRDNNLRPDAMGDDVRRVIGLIRLQAKSMDQLVPAALSNHAQPLGLEDWVETTKRRAAELRADADEFERVAIAAGVMAPEATPPRSLFGIWKGMVVTDEDIEEAKRSLFKEFEE